MVLRNRRRTARLLVWATLFPCAGLMSCCQAVFCCASDAAYSVRTWQIEDGSNNVIQDVAQTRDGYLWVGTSTGISEFDGVHFVHHSTGKLDGLNIPYVRMMLAARNGGLWVVYQGAVMFIDRGKPPVIVRDDIPAQLPDSLVEDTNGALWIGYRQGPVCKIKNGRAKQYDAEAGFPDGKATSLAVDNSGRLWYARDERVGIIKDDRFTEIFTAPHQSALAPASDGGLWISSYYTLFKYHDDTGLVQLASLPIKHTGSSTMHPLEDTSGTLWCRTLTGGLFRFNGRTLDKVETPQSRIICFTEDKDGNLWAGTDAGLDRISPRAIELEREDVGRPSASVSSICQAKDGQIWAAMVDGTLMVLADGRWKPAPFEFRGAATTVTAGPDGAVWFATHEQALFRWLDGKLDKWANHDGLRGHITTALLAAKNGDLWIGSYALDSLQCFRNNRFIDFELPQELHRIDAIVEDRDGNIWVASSGIGYLLRVKNDKLINETGPIGHKAMQTLAVTPDNALWIGFRDGGLGRLKNGKYREITREQGLYDDSITQIVPDANGDVWFGWRTASSKSGSRNWMTWPMERPKI